MVHCLCAMLRIKIKLIYDHWFLDPLRKKGLSPLIIGVACARGYGGASLSSKKFLL
jgi:hypothetical protein